MKDHQSGDQMHGGEATERLKRAATAAQQLCDTLWEALHAELQAPDPERVRDLSQRLSDIAATVSLLADAVSAAPSPPPREDERRSPPALVPERRESARHSSSVEDPPTGEPAASQPIPTSAGNYTFTRLVDEQGSTAPVDAQAPSATVPPEIEIRDVRREEGPSAWVSSVGRLLRAHAEDGLPFAVLLVEIVDVARLERSSTPHDMHGLVAKVEDALGRGMRTNDHLSRETLGRYWLVAPETNGTGARMLAERLARLVRTSASHRGVPLEVAIGIAVCPEDGVEAPALAARADLGVYAARATGRSVAHSEPPAG